MNQLAPSKPRLVKFTLQVEPVNAAWAASLATRFMRDYPDKLTAKRPDRNGCIYSRSDNIYFYVFGTADHIRVRQSTE